MYRAGKQRCLEQQTNKERIVLPPSPPLCLISIVLLVRTNARAIKPYPSQPTSSPYHSRSIRPSIQTTDRLIRQDHRPISYSHNPALTQSAPSLPSRQNVHHQANPRRRMAHPVRRRLRAVEEGDPGLHGAAAWLAR